MADRNLKDKTKEEQGKLGEGATIGATIDNQVTVSIKPSDNFYQNLEKQYVSSMGAFLMTQNERTAKFLQEANERFEQTMNDALAQQNQQGRQLAGGGG